MNLAGATIAPNMSELFLNGFSVSFTREDFTGYIRPMPDNQQLEATREALGDEWFISWRDGIAYGLPKLQPPSKSFGTAQTLKVADHLSLLARRLTDVLPEKFPKYEAFRRKPFKFRGQKDEIVAAIMTKLKRLPPVVGKFKIHLTFELDARLIECCASEVDRNAGESPARRVRLFTTEQDLNSAAARRGWKLRKMSRRAVMKMNHI